MVLILLFACLKPAAPLAIGADRPLTVVSVLDAAGEVAAADTPPRFDTTLLESARARKLTPTLVESGERFTLLTAKRETLQRIDALAGADALLLVETAPVYYSELSGQYRWIVGVHLTLKPPGGAAIEARFDVPVFLRYHHEREAEAVDAASPVVERRLGELLDGWLGSGG